MENKMTLSQLVDVLSKKSYHRLSDFKNQWGKYKGLFFVYFIINNDEKTIYIGHTKDLYNRIVCHQQRFKFYRFGLIQYNTYQEMLTEEKLWIKYYKPDFNIKSKAN